MNILQTLTGSSNGMDDNLNNETDILKNQVINFTLFMYSTIGTAVFCVYIYFWVFVYKMAWDGYMSFLTVIFTGFIISTIYNKKLSYEVKAYIVLTFFLILGAVTLCVWGFLGPGIPSFLMFCIFTSVFFDTRKGVYSSAVAFTIIAVIGVFISFEIIQLDYEFINWASKLPSTWIIIIIMTSLNVFCLLYSHGKFNQSLNNNIEMLNNQTDELKQEVTERKKVEISLRESELKYRTLFEHAGDAILLLKDGIIIDCNQRTYDLFDRSREEIVMKTPFDLSPEKQPDGRTSREKGLAFLASLSETKTETFEWIHTKGNGSVIYTEPRLTEMEFNKEIYTLVILLNTTDRKLVEEKLLEEKNFSESVINSLPGIFFMYDEGKNLIRWNNNHEHITGYSSGELRKMKIHDFVDEDAKPYVDHKIDEALIEGTFRMELNFNIKCGEKIPFDFIGRTIDINQRTYLLGLGFDLSDRKSAEKALMSSEKRFRELVETIAIGISIVKDGIVAYMNPKQVAILGKYPDSFEMKDMPFHPEDLSRVLNDYEAVLCGEIRTFEHEVRLMQYRKTTEKRTTILVFCNGSRINYMGEAAVLITMVDITKTRELEQLVHLREKMVSLGHVAAGIAHEIRNPLSGINILVDGIREDFEEAENTERVKKDIVEIQKASNKISAVIKRVLDFSRPGVPSLVLSDVNNSVNEAVELSKVTLRKAGVSVTAKLAVNLPKLMVDGQAMEQVFLNMITNAANAMINFEGEKKVEVVSWLEEDEIFLTVSDSGNGILDELKEKIFDPFFTTRSDGSGIGLSLCQRIIADHGGTIHVSDSELGGAEFKIKLPVQKG